MACNVETLAGKPILSEVADAGAYGSRLEGYIIGYRNECKLSYIGSTLTMGSGVIVLNGKRIIIDDEGISVDIPVEPSGTNTYWAFLKIDMAAGKGTLEYADSTNPPGFVQDDLFLNPTNGVHWLEAGVFINSTTGITDLTNLLKSLTGVTELFFGKAAVGQTIDLKYPLDVLKSAKHIDLKLELLNVKLQGIVSYNNATIFFGSYYQANPAGSQDKKGVGIPLAELHLVSGTTWLVYSTLVTYTNQVANIEGRKVESVEVQF